MHKPCLVRKSPSSWEGSEGTSRDICRTRLLAALGTREQPSPGLSKQPNQATGRGGGDHGDLQQNGRSSLPLPMKLGHGRSLLGFLVGFVSCSVFVVLSVQYGIRPEKLYENARNNQQWPPSPRSCHSTGFLSRGNHGPLF